VPSVRHRTVFMKRSVYFTSALTLFALASSSLAFAFQPPTTPPDERRERGPEGGRGRGQGRQGRQGEARGPGGPGGPARVSPFVAAIDTNKDGDLSVEELANAPTALKTLDKNGDGKLSGEEVRPTPPPIVVPASEIVARFMEFDRNSDGKLSVSELPSRMKSFLQQADSNKDGILAQDELISFTEKQEVIRQKESADRAKKDEEQQKKEGTPPPPRRVAPIIAALDTNQDGEISAEEIATATTALKALDKNNDGKITPEELRPAPAPEPGPGQSGTPAPAENR
jgi:Ca2+-binding EF-hand superfamily protein